ncbi:WD repeat-containing protein 47-like [Stegodyphus dumicola]|uniref:WD repeat-containing protein 47-like n=1 Tax=Stegodyphus dumicola TaxID=202533 RepID=UPI0015A988A5|nr:WD repeat-containing protein 47-like [Stegodyphus dumicola]
MATDTFCLKEEDIIRLMEAYLDQRGLHMTLDALERETGVIHFEYPKETLTLRQCIVDGRWREAISHLRSLPIKEEDLKFIIFEIMKQKYVELICVYEELGNELYDDLGNAIAICFSELSAYCSCPVEYENLRKLASLTKLSQDPKFEDWNPFASRRKCFNTIYSVLVSEDNLYQLENNSEENRLLDLLVKGVLYESCEEYCQLKASTKSESATTFRFGSLVQSTQTVGSNLSLYSWLQSVPWITMTHSFVHRFLRVEVDKIERPEMRECWTEKILQSAKEFAPYLQNELQRPDSSSENLKSRFWNKRIKDSMIVDASEILKRAEEVVNRWKTRQTQHLEIDKRIGHDTKISNLPEGKIDVHDQRPPQQTSISAKSSDLIPVIESLNEYTSTITEIAHNHRISQQTFPTDKSSDFPHSDEENINEYISFPDPHLSAPEQSSVPQMLSELPPILEENLNESTSIIDEFSVLQPSINTEISSLNTNSAESQLLADRFGCPVCSVVENDNFDVENDFKEHDTKHQPDRGDVSDQKQSIRDLIHAKLKLRGNLLKILKGEFPEKAENNSANEYSSEIKQQNQVHSITAAAEIPRINCFSKVTYIPPFYMQPYLLIKDSGTLKKLFSTANESDIHRQSTTISSERKTKVTSCRNLMSPTDKKSDTFDKVPYKANNFVSNRRDEGLNFVRRSRLGRKSSQLSKAAVANRWSLKIF